MGGPNTAAVKLNRVIQLLRDSDPTTKRKTNNLHPTTSSLIFSALHVAHLLSFCLLVFSCVQDFTDAATKGAVAVVHGHIPPVNPMDAPRSYVFIYNSIFFSFAVEGRDLDEQAAAGASAGAAADVKVRFAHALTHTHAQRMAPSPAALFLSLHFGRDEPFPV
jgi:hypothetical protein